MAIMDQKSEQPLLEVERLSVAFGRGAGSVRAVDEVSIDISRGDLFALVGESGCGKSTLAYSLLNLITPPGQVVSGCVRLRGRDLMRMSKHELDGVRGAEIALVFQAAMNAFNPVVTIGGQVEHILRAHGDVFSSRADGRTYFEHLLGMVRLPASRTWDAYESQLSGGMKQRVAIAVALLLKPAILVLDEPTTALDVLNQRLVIDVLRDLYEALGVTIVFVTHDLAVVAELASKVGVMYAGRLVEVGPVDEVFLDARRHPYVARLIDAIPSVLAGGASARPIPGQVPDLTKLPPGCRFHPRCELALPQCRVEEPPLVDDGKGHSVACWVANEELSGSGASA